MTTPTDPHDLGVKPELAVALKRALRLVHELADKAGELPMTDSLRLQRHLKGRMQEAQALVKAAGVGEAKAQQLVRQLLFQMQEATPEGERDYLSLEEAMGTNKTG